MPRSSRGDPVALARSRVYALALACLAAAPSGEVLAQTSGEAGSRTLRLAPAGAPPVLSTPRRAQEEDEEGPEEQDLLFLSDEAYTQEAGELQVALAGALGWRGEADARATAAARWEVTTIAEVEFGLTDRLQVAAELPWVRSRFPDAEAVADPGGRVETDLGAVEVELAFALLEEEGGEAPEVSVALETNSDGWSAGRGIAVAAAKRFAGRHTAFLSLGREWEEEEEDSEDETESATTIALGYDLRVTEHTHLLAEWMRGGELGPEVEGGDQDAPLTATLGVLRRSPSGFSYGLATGVGRRAGRTTGWVLLTIQFER